MKKYLLLMLLVVSACNGSTATKLNDGLGNVSGVYTFEPVALISGCAKGRPAISLRREYNVIQLDDMTFEMIGVGATLSGFDDEDGGTVVIEESGVKGFIEKDGAFYASSYVVFTVYGILGNITNSYTFQGKFTREGALTQAGWEGQYHAITEYEEYGRRECDEYILQFEGVKE